MLRRRFSAVKPRLTPTHKKRRLEFALRHVRQPRGLRQPRFVDMYDVVHIDEKWFNMYKGATHYYMTPTEDLPHHTSPNKRYIGKVMFLAAVARPRYDFGRRTYFNGKIGIWPVVERVQAQRSSVNILSGDWETKNISMTSKEYAKMLMTKVFPAIRATWPGCKRRPIAYSTTMQALMGPRFWKLFKMPERSAAGTYVWSSSRRSHQISTYWTSLFLMRYSRSSIVNLRTRPTLS